MILLCKAKQKSEKLSVRSKIPLLTGKVLTSSRSRPVTYLCCLVKRMRHLQTDLLYIVFVLVLVLATKYLLPREFFVAAKINICMFFFTF